MIDWIDFLADFFDAQHAKAEEAGDPALSDLFHYVTLSLLDLLYELEDRESEDETH